MIKDRRLTRYGSTMSMAAILILLCLALVMYLVTHTVEGRDNTNIASTILIFCSGVVIVLVQKAHAERNEQRLTQQDNKLDLISKQTNGGLTDLIQQIITENNKKLDALAQKNTQEIGTITLEFRSIKHALTERLNAAILEKEVIAGEKKVLEEKVHSLELQLALKNKDA